MEVATILIVVVVFIISSLLIYCTSAVSMREKTFEEVIAEQRQQQEKEREKAKAEKKAEKDLVKKKSFKKGKVEKVKEKSAQVNEPELKSSEHKMVNLEIEPEIIEPSESTSLGASVRQRNVKKEKVKPVGILVNKDVPPLIAPKQLELIHKPIVPKDEMELKKAHEKVVEKPPKSESPKKEGKTKSPGSSTEVKENLPPKGSSAPKEDVKTRPSEEDRSAVKAKQTIGDVALNGSRLVSAVKNAKLSDSEVQNLIDILLNRQGLSPTGPVASEVWNKKSQKGDPVSILKKQLEEKEKLLQEEKNNTVGLMSRTKEMKNELVVEKTKIVQLEKQYQEQLLRQGSELDALKQRMQHTHEQHLHEINSLQSRLHQIDSGADRAQAQKISEENKILQDSLTIKTKENIGLTEKINQLEKDVSANLNKVKASEAAKKGLESKTSMYEDKIRQLEDVQRNVDAMVKQRVEEVTHELRKAESKNNSLTTELQNATGALGTTQGEVTSLKAKLQELEGHLTKVDASKETEAKLQVSERKCLDFEKNVKNLEKRLADLSQRLDGSTTELQRLQQENKSLKDTNTTIQEKLVNAPALASNGNLHENSLTLEEHERILSEKTREVGETQKKTIGSLQTQLDLKAAELKDLQTQLSQQRDKNNELREKNWKAMEALEKSEKAEKALKSARDVESSSSAEVESHDKAVFQKLFPDIRVAEKLVHKEWVAAFQKQAESKLSSYTPVEKLQQVEKQHKEASLKVSKYEKQISDLESKAKRLHEVEEENRQLQQSSQSTSPVDSERTSQLEAENKKLQAEVDHYSSIVSDTEGKLRQLEKSIDAEEKKWHEKLKQARAEGQKSSGSSQARVSELESLLAGQGAELQEYRRVLSMAEARLKELESKIGEEEKSWQGKLSAAQNEAAEMKNKFTSLKQELNASKGSQEMKAEKERLEEELKEAQDKIIVITKEKEVVSDQLKESQSQASSTSSQEVSELRTQLEGERKRNKELSMNVVKLNGIIKTGHDALTQEQALVKKLQQSLDTKSMSSGISDIEETDQASPGAENGTSV